MPQVLSSNQGKIREICENQREKFVLSPPPRRRRRRRRRRRCRWSPERWLNLLRVWDERGEEEEEKGM